MPRRELPSPDGWRTALGALREARVAAHNIWRRENSKLKLMQSDDPEYYAQYRRMRDASSNYRVAKAAENAARAASNRES